EGLGLIGDASAVPAIYQAAGGCRERLAAVEPDDEHLPAAPDIDLCRVALTAFLRLQNYDAIAGLAIDAQGRPVSRWWPVAFALQRINDPRTAPALLQLAETPGIYTAGFALRGLAALKEKRALPIATAIAANANRDLKLRIAAIRTLGEVGGP